MWVRKRFLSHTHTFSIILYINNDRKYFDSGEWRERTYWLKKNFKQTFLGGFSIQLIESSVQSETLSGC